MPIVLVQLFCSSFFFIDSRWELVWWFCLICHLLIWGSHVEDYSVWFNPPQRDRLFLRLLTISWGRMYDVLWRVILSGYLVHFKSVWTKQSLRFPDISKSCNSPRWDEIISCKKTKKQLKLPCCQLVMQ